jgi:hypothetical protein
MCETKHAQKLSRLHNLKERMEWIELWLTGMSKRLSIIRQKHALKEFLVDGCTRSDLIIFSPKPTRHPTTRTLEFTTLIVCLDPCPISKGYCANHEFVVVSCDCVYHPWCITVHV